MHNFIPSSFQANLAQQVDAMTALARLAFKGGTDIVNLNLDLARSRLEDSSAAMNQFMSAKSPQDYFSIATSQARQDLEKTVAHYRAVTEITKSTQAGFSEIIKSKAAQAAA